MTIKKIVSSLFVFIFIVQIAQLNAFTGSMSRVINRTVGKQLLNKIPKRSFCKNTGQKNPKLREVNPREQDVIIIEKKDLKKLQDMLSSKKITEEEKALEDGLEQLGEVIDHDLLEKLRRARTVAITFFGTTVTLLGYIGYQKINKNKKKK